MVMIALGVAAAPAEARTLRVEGTAGYLSEWEFKGELSQRAPADGNDYSGSVTWTHVGLCSVNGPETKSGAIRIRLSTATPPQIDATISFEGGQCVYRGEFSDSSSGFMDCPDAKGVALSISVQ
jgi:hypothetical protein